MNVALETVCPKLPGLSTAYLTSENFLRKVTAQQVTCLCGMWCTVVMQVSFFEKGFTVDNHSIGVPMGQDADVILLQCISEEKSREVYHAQHGHRKPQDTYIKSIL